MQRTFCRIAFETRRAVLFGMLMSMSFASVSAAETAPGFCEARVESFSVRVLAGSSRITREGPNKIRIEPRGLKAVCAFTGRERLENSQTALDFLSATQKPDAVWIGKFARLIGDVPKVSHNGVRPSPFTSDPFYYVTVAGETAVAAIGVHADPNSRTYVSGNCFIQRPVPTETLGALLLMSASVYFEPDEGLPECELD